MWNSICSTRSQLQSSCQCVGKFVGVLQLHVPLMECGNERKEVEVTGCPLCQAIRSHTSYYTGHPITGVAMLLASKLLGEQLMQNNIL